MNTKKRNQDFYQFALHYLDQIKLKGIDLEKYYAGDDKDVTNLKGVYESFIKSAQNYQRMPNIVKYEKNKDAIYQILDNLDYCKIAERDPMDLSMQFIEKLNPESKTKGNKQNSWYKWSTAIVDLAGFISQFHTLEEFHNYIARFNQDADGRLALAMMISVRIRNFGFALACNALKELGYMDYCKPDVHIIEICKALSGREDINQYTAFYMLCKIAEDNDVTPYKVDKVLWLICSGYFYKDSEVKSPHKKDFIEKVKEQLKEES